MGAPAPPGWRKNRHNLQGKFVSAFQTHQVHLRQSKSQFLGHFLLCQEDLELDLVVLDRVLEATTKKGHLFEEKSAHQTKSWLRLW